MSYARRGLGDTSTQAVPIVDFLDGALTWADDFQGSLVDSMNLAFGQPLIAVDQPVTGMKIAGFLAVPIVGVALSWLVLDLVMRGHR